MGEKSINILIAENIPSLNKGEMTILGGMIESFQILGKTAISMFSKNPEIDRPRYEPTVKIIDIGRSKSSKSVISISQLISSIVLISEHFIFLLLYKILGRKVFKVMKAELWKQYANCHVIIIGHDNTYGLLVGATYFYYIYLPLFARILNKPIVFYGGSILKEQRPAWLWAVALRFSLRRINLVTLRERITYERLKRNKLLNNKIVITGDPAFLLPPATYEKAVEILKQEGISTKPKPLIGMTITHEAACQAFPDLDSVSSYQKHITMIAETIDHLVAKYDAILVFLPHCIGPETNLDDRVIANEIILKCKNPSRVKTIEKEYTASELKGIIGQCNLFIGERIHSTINALSMEVPTIVLVNKNDQRMDIIDMFGQKTAICYTNNLEAGTLIKKAEDTWSKASLIKQELHTNMSVFREKAMSNGKLLQDLLNSSSRNFTPA